MTSGINEANRVSYNAPRQPPKRLENCPENLSHDTVDQVFREFTEQFGTKELLEWAHWYKTARMPSVGGDFGGWWNYDGRKSLVIGLLLMTGVGCSTWSAESPLIRRLLDWYGLED